MRVDVGNALAAVADPGIGRNELETLDERVADAHDRISAGRADEEFGYAALNLPETTDPDAIEATVEPVADSEAVLTVGIGGSALGAATVSTALDDGDAADHYVLDNVDPEHTTALLESLDLSSTLTAVTRSTSTR